MRDRGTEMTSIASQEPSRSVTRVSATTPIRSPTSSIPSTPRRGEPAPTPTEYSGNEAIDRDELEQIEYAKRAVAWEEAEKSKHAARFEREEIRIQAWESQQKARLEAEMRKIESK
ncbi:hypothetical protein ABFS82_13G177800 [Erythranthe guttata]|uniref:remorin-like isoform X2 n=1 Tax=Erythranthe guttata TaxID=4155 RepID=UPI00064DAFC1|nr:PREDICTED: remorin-like isoform X2 [Erythranthe guttata]|eukprot:XP_012827436.1 PREDICTED: remorin-like isoform X2 [Erythranthe guttata]